MLFNFGDSQNSTFSKTITFTLLGFVLDKCSGTLKSLIQFTMSKTPIYYIHNADFVVQNDDFVYIDE